MEPEKKPAPKFMRYLKGLGWGAFLFFLLKGLVWLAIFLGLGKYFS